MWCGGNEKGCKLGVRHRVYKNKKSRDLANAMFLDFLNDLSVLAFKIFLN